MYVTSTLIEPGIVSRSGLMGLWNKFSVCLCELAESNDDIGGGDRLFIEAFKNLSSATYIGGLGFPLQIRVRVTYGIDPRVIAIISAQLFARQDIACGWVDEEGAQAHRGRINNVLPALSTDIIKHLVLQTNIIASR